LQILKGELKKDRDAAGKLFFLHYKEFCLVNGDYRKRIILTACLKTLAHPSST